MFDDILKIVQEHLGNDPEVAATLPPEQADSVHREVAEQIHTGIQNPAALLGEGGISSLLSGGPGANNPIVGNLVNNLVVKCGLSPEAGSAITAALPGLLQKVLSHGSGSDFPFGGFGGLSKGLGGFL